MALNFNYSALYEVKEEIEKELETLEEDSERAIQLEDRLDTINDTISFIEDEDKDRHAEYYAYEVSYSQDLIEYARANQVEIELLNAHYNIIKDCDWNDSIPTVIKFNGRPMKVSVTIHDHEEIIQLYMTL